MNEVKCPSCSNKSVYFGLTDLELIKKGNKIAGLKKIYLILEKINFNDNKEVNEYKLIFTYQNSQIQEIPLSHFLQKEEGGIMKLKHSSLKRGWVSCINCGYAKSINKENVKYIYAVSIGDRHLVAKNEDEFIKIYKRLENREKVHDPKWGIRGYPKIFWLKRDELLRKMAKKIEELK